MIYNELKGRASILLNVTNSNSLRYKHYCKLITDLLQELQNKEEENERLRKALETINALNIDSLSKLEHALGDTHNDET